MLEYAIRAPDPGPPPFTPRQRHGIRGIARRYGYAYDQRWDFVHETWLSFHRGWLHVPRVEPAMTKYVFRIAHNLARKLFKRFEDDAMTGAVVFSCLPEWEREDEPEQDGEDRPGTPEVAYLSIEKRIYARELLALAEKHDPEGADWLVLAKVGDWTVPEIAAEVGQPAARIYKRMSRLLESLRAPVPCSGKPYVARRAVTRRRRRGARGARRGRSGSGSGSSA